MLSLNPYESSSFPGEPGSTQSRLTIKRIAPLSCATMLGALYGIAGLLIGGIFSIISLLGGGGNEDAPEFLVFGAAAVIILPLMYGLMGAVSGLIMAALYNVMARVIGGIQLHVLSGEE